MRYTIGETVNILGVFSNGDTVTIDIYDLADNSLVVDGGSCTEIGSTGIFNYQFLPSISSRTVTKKAYFWEMNDGATTYKYGKLIFGGFPDNIENQTDQLHFTGTKVNAVIDSESDVIPDIEDKIDNIEEDLMSPDLTAILRYFGFSQKNCRIKLEYTTINEKKKISDATISVFNNEHDCDTNTNIQAQYTINMQYDEEGNVTEYKMTESEVEEAEAE